jgi:hypothetical protein
MVTSYEGLGTLLSRPPPDISARWAVLYGRAKMSLPKMGEIFSNFLTFLSCLEAHYRAVFLGSRCNVQARIQVVGPMIQWKPGTNDQGTGGVMTEQLLEGSISKRRTENQQRKKKHL